jgi:hypothetical protein
MRAPLMVILIFIILLFAPNLLDAQCAMCKAVAEDASSQTGVGKGINAGILYLMGIPYILLTILYFSFFHKKKISL